MISGSGNAYFSTVRIDPKCADCQLWWSEGAGLWHWQLIWEDGSPYGTHVHHGNAKTHDKARADIVRTIIWIEDTWPKLEYYEGA